MLEQRLMNSWIYYTTLHVHGQFSLSNHFRLLLVHRINRQKLQRQCHAANSVQLQWQPTVLSQVCLTGKHTQNTMRLHRLVWWYLLIKNKRAKGVNPTVDCLFVVMISNQQLAVFTLIMMVMICFRFYYFMYGTNLGQLTLWKMDQNNQLIGSPFWTYPSEC